MVKKLICLTCGENITMQMDLDKLKISTDCKNAHHFREIPFNAYYNYLPNYNNLNEDNISAKNKYVFYCYLCHKNVDIKHIEKHNGHDGIKLSIKEFLPKEKCIEYYSSIKHKNFNKELEKINQVIKDFNEWKIMLDKKFFIFIQFLKHLYEIEKYFFDDLLKNSDDEEIYYNYESLINIKEIYMINNSIKNFRHDYSNINSNFNKMSYFFINKITDINEEENNMTLKNIEPYYKGNKCYFNEEIKYKSEKNDNIFPLIKNLFQNCKSFVGYDHRYFKEKESDNFHYSQDDQNLHKFLLQVKNNIPNITHISNMRNKSYFSCAAEKNIIILKNNESKLEKINIINCCNFRDKNNNMLFSLELSNKKLLGISDEYIKIFDSFNSSINNIDEYYKNYFISKNIILLNKIDDIIQISPKLFCTYSQNISEIFFWDIKYMEVVTKLGGIRSLQNNSKYLHLLDNSDLLITGEEYIYIISIFNLEIKAKIKSDGLISSFCLLPKNGILCGEILINYGPYSPFNKENNEYNLVQYQINEKGIQKISEKKKVHKDVIRSLYYLGNNIILSCSNNGELKIWY
jgi:hypothetical protein